MSLEKSIDLIIKNASQILTLKGGSLPRRGNRMKDLGIIRNGSVCISNDKISWVGPTNKLQKSWLKQAKQVIDVSGKLVMPGLVDPHTHLVFGGSREKEFALRSSGASYREIAKAGGGIISTVRETRRTSEKELLQTSLKKLNQMMELGTTTVEIKSGYGLNLEDEIKILKTIQELGKHHPMTVISTFLGAHTCPPEREKKSYLDLVNNIMIPHVATHNLAEFCDVFCEEWVFSLEESRKILEKAKSCNLQPKIHTDQFNPNGGYKIALELDAVSADHLDYLSDQGMKEMAASNVIGVLLPGAVFFLGSEKYPSARKMIDSSMAIALATDFNPGSSMTQSMPLMMTIACTQMGMTPEETITSSTINAACAIKRESSIGSIEQGKQADIIIIDATDFRYLPYHFGVNLVTTIIKNGKIITFPI